MVLIKKKAVLMDDFGSKRARKISKARRKRLLAYVLQNHVQARGPDFIIGPPDDPYLLRWYHVRKGQRWRDLSPARRAQLLEEDNPRDDDSAANNVFVHIFVRSDDDRALHDHPWGWRTVLLEGHYDEFTPLDDANPAGPRARCRREAGDVVYRAPEHSHCIALTGGAPALTLFSTGPKVREWGFWCKGGWRHWRDYTAAGTLASMRGCGD